MNDVDSTQPVPTAVTAELASHGGPCGTTSLGNFTRVDWLILSTFAIMTALVAFSHELGHDEAQAWNITRAAAMPWDLFATTRVEGHTPFWHALLWPLTRIGVPGLMQTLTALFAIVVAALLLRDRPFPRWICVLVIFSYFPFYEYSIIPRPYGLALMLCALLASRLYRGGASLITLALLCSLIAFTSAFGAAMSASLMLLVLLEATQPDTRIRSISPMTVAGSIGLYVTITLVGAWLIIFPTGSTEFEAQVITGGRMSAPALPQPIINATFPHLDRLPLGIGAFVTTPTGWWLTLVAALATVLGVLVWLWPRPAARLPWCAAVIIVSTAAAYVDSLADRHVGHLFMAAFLLCWAARGLTPVERWQSLTSVWQRHVAGRRAPATELAVRGPSLSGAHSGALGLLRPIAGTGLTLALLYQVMAGIGAAGLDVAREQSPWRSIAAYIQANVDQPYTLLLDSGYLAGGVTSYLDVEPHDMGCDCRIRYTRWDTLREIPSRRRRGQTAVRTREQRRESGDPDYPQPLVAGRAIRPARDVRPRVSRTDQTRTTACTGLPVGPRRPICARSPKMEQ